MVNTILKQLFDHFLNLQVRQFLRSTSSICDQEFSTDAAMFVFNKWDTVPEIDKSDLTKTTLSQLKKLFPGIQKDQLFYISATEVHCILRKSNLPFSKIFQKVLKNVNDPPSRYC